MSTVVILRTLPMYPAQSPLPFIGGRLRHHCRGGDRNPGSLAPGLAVMTLVPWMGFCGPLLLKPPLLESVAGCFLLGVWALVWQGPRSPPVPTSPHQQRDKTRMLLVEARIVLFGAAGTITNDI